MNIDSISKCNSPSFGIKCSTHIKAKILDNYSDNSLPAYFNNTGKLISNIDNIGSDAVTLSSYKIERITWDTDDKSGALDRCYIKFKMKTPNGKQKTVYETIDSKTFDYVDLYENFIKVENRAERNFINEYLKQMSNKGKLEETSIKLEELYSEQKNYIYDCASSEEYKMRDYLAQKYKKTSFLNKLKIMLHINGKDSM